MLTLTELFRHTWASSRQDDENFICFSRAADYVVVSYSCLWDSTECIVDDGEVKVPIPVFLKALREIPETDGVSKSVEGMDPNTTLSFTRNGTEANVYCNWGSDGGNTSVPIAKLLELCAKLEQFSPE